jgi:hypothetical protein
MKGHVRGLVHSQNGYSKINLEDGVLSPQDSDLEIRDTSFYAHSAEFLWRCGSVLMFLSGALMLLAAQHRKPSDQECTAQLSIWCETNHSFDLKCIKESTLLI